MLLTKPLPYPPTSPSEASSSFQYQLIPHQCTQTSLLPSPGFFNSSYYNSDNYHNTSPLYTLQLSSMVGVKSQARFNMVEQCEQVQNLDKNFLQFSSPIFHSQLGDLNLLEF